jgi:hypothetical protein
VRSQKSGVRIEKQKGRSVCAPGVIAGPQAGSCLAPRTQPLVPAFIVPAMTDEEQ